MSRPTSPHAPLVIRRVLEGVSTKEIAFETGMTPGAVAKIITNTSMRKEYVTPLEYQKLIDQRKGSFEKKKPAEETQPRRAASTNNTTTVSET